MDFVRSLTNILLFPSGLFLMFSGLIYEWVERKLIARMQNRVGPRWFQPIADVFKLLAKEEIVPIGVNELLFNLLPVLGLAGALTAALYVPMFGFEPAFSFSGDLIVALYLLSLVTLCIGLAGSNTQDRFSMVGAVRALTQVFSYEAPFMLALLGPAILAQSWQIDQIEAFISGRWLLLAQPLGFLVAVIGLMGKLELPPFDAPEAETEIVAGAFTEYSGRGFAIFKLAKSVEMVVGLTLIAAFFMGGLANPLDYLLKTLVLLLILAIISAVLTRFRIDQVVRWWRYGAMLALLQLLLMIVF
ncbi:MAG TPA: complex I subunit 1 family protein [Anaerolineales bacterium]|nr:complex I subunit 1 family protein [Anaerolineales bacterium]